MAEPDFPSMQEAFNLWREQTQGWTANREGMIKIAFYAGWIAHEEMVADG